jgi:hypothetical protein
MCQGEALRPSNRSLVVGLWRSLVILVADNVAMSWYSDILEHTLVKVHVLQVDFLNSLGLSHLTPSLRLAQLCPTCYQVMPLTGVCDNCGLGNRFNCSAKFQDRRSVAAGASGSAWRLRPSPT